MATKTKDQLIAENAKLSAIIEREEDAEFKLRKSLSELLGSYDYIQEYGNMKQGSVWVRDWVSIAFLIGELKADANYARVIEDRDSLRSENQQLKEQIHKLQHPSETAV